MRDANGQRITDRSGSTDYCEIRLRWCAHYQLNGRANEQLSSENGNLYLADDWNVRWEKKQQEWTWGGDTHWWRGWGWKRRGSCQLQKTQSSCTLMHTASHDKLHQREEGGGRHCTESTSTTMDGHTPNIHAHTYTLLHRVPVCVPPHSPGCQNLAVSLSRKEMKQQNNRLTNKRKEEHTLWIRLARIKK